jgi:2-methylisocitrate lyase-like PEP mutase family enzyme
MPRSPLRPLLARGRCLVAPGVFDLISTHVLNQHPVDATYVTGFGLVASSLGLPDAGLATYTEMIERIVEPDTFPYRSSGANFDGIR